MPRISSSRTDPAETIVKAGGTSYRFVTHGVDAALRRAREAALDQDFAVAGGASVVRQFLSRRVIDELHLQVVPVLLGGGVRLFVEPADRALTLTPIDCEVDDDGVTHLGVGVRLDRS